MLASISAQNAPGALQVTESEQTLTPQAEIIGDDSDLFTVDSLVRRRARSNPDIHAISYPSSGIDFVNYTVQQLDVFAWRVAKQYEQSLPVRSSSAEKPRVIALLGPSNLEYLITLLALTKLGHTVLPLSTRIPQPAIENLMNVTGAQMLIAEARFLELAGKVSDSMSIELLEIAPRSVFEFPIEVHAETKLDQALDPKIEQDNIAFIIHSSGKLTKPGRFESPSLTLYRFDGSAKAHLSDTQGLHCQLCKEHGNEGFDYSPTVPQPWHLQFIPCDICSRAHLFL
jgi:non-ribosomal peptide synthetase component F